MNGNRKPRITLAAVVAALALGVAACGAGEDVGNPDSNLSLDEATAVLEGAPHELAALRSEGSQLLDGGTGAFEERLAELEGHPVVVNKWASWCGPCRAEFPYFQSQAEERGSEVAFIGVGANDSEDALATFLEELPLPYPTYLDPDLEISKNLGGPTQAFPATAFYDSSGQLVFTHNGLYVDEAALAADVDKYAN
ncbi:hypothetical protein BH20ACT15_BH20ACT15_15360 [soil metagenome]